MQFRSSLGGEHSNSLQYSCLEKTIDRETWQATVQRITKSWTQLKQLSMLREIIRWEESCCYCLVTKLCLTLLQPHGLQPARLVCPWNFPGKNTNAKVLVAQSYLTVNPWTSPPGSSIHGIHQARILEWVAIPFSRCLLDPGIEPRSPALKPDSLLSESPGTPTILEMVAISFSRGFSQPRVQT